MTPTMIRFRFDGPVATGFDLIGAELGPDEEFEVPEHLGLAFDNHGHCTCLEPEKIEPLRAAEKAWEAEQDALRAVAAAPRKRAVASVLVVSDAETAPAKSAKAKTATDTTPATAA